MYSHKSLRVPSHSRANEAYQQQHLVTYTIVQVVVLCICAGDQGHAGAVARWPVASLSKNDVVMIMNMLRSCCK